MKAQVPVSHIAQLANIPITQDEEKKLESAFDETMAVVEKLQSVDVRDVAPTFQVTGLENVTREDIVDESRMFSQEQALANARAQHDGFFVVPQVISQD